MVLSGQTIEALCKGDRPMVSPFHERTYHEGMTFGLGPAGYDVRIKQNTYVMPGEFALASTVEHFDIPADVLATVMDKSTWARLGLSLFNTVIEPGWKGWLTLELVNHSADVIEIPAGAPIAQIIFQRLNETTDRPYSGRYQSQPDRPVEAILQEGTK